MSSHSKLNKVSAAGLLIALGIIYGDIGTSPLYVFNEILKGKVVSELLIIGGGFDTISSFSIASLLIHKHKDNCRVYLIVIRKHMSHYEQ